MRNFTSRNEIRQIFTASYPFANGQFERQVQKIFERNNMDITLSRIHFGLRLTPHCTSPELGAESNMDRRLRN